MNNVLSPVIVTVFSLAISWQAHSQQLTKTDSSEHWLTPDSVVFQSAAYLGALSVGAGYDVSEIYSFDVAFGYTPETVGGRAIRNISFKNNFELLSMFAAKPTKSKSVVWLPRWV